MTSHNLTKHPGDPGMGKEMKGNRKGLGGDHMHRAEDDEAVMKKSPELSDRQGKDAPTPRAKR